MSENEYTKNLVDGKTENIQKLEKEAIDLPSQVNFLKNKSNMTLIVSIAFFVLGSLTFIFNFFYEKDELEVHFSRIGIDGHELNADITFINKGTQDALVSNIMIFINNETEPDNYILILSSLDPILIPPKSIRTAHINNTMIEPIKRELIKAEPDRVRLNIYWDITSIVVNKGKKQDFINYGTIIYDFYASKVGYYKTVFLQSPEHKPKELRDESQPKDTVINEFERISWRNGVYLGSLKDGKPHHGTWISSSHSQYHGEWKHGKFHGQGTFAWIEGDEYEGEWKVDKRDGHGTMVWRDGLKYEGEWEDHKMDGRGTMIWQDGTMYEGEWKDHKMDGSGVFTYLDNFKYKGNWIEGDIYSKGVWVCRDGKEYVDIALIYSSFYDQWTWIDPYGKRYIGEFKNDMFHGQGTYYWPGGDKYEGEWKDHKMDGHGTMIRQDGTMHEGEWKNDVAHGIGTYTYDCGYKFEGIWHEGDFVEKIEVKEQKNN